MQIFHFFHSLSPFRSLFVSLSLFITIDRPHFIRLIICSVLFYDFHISGYQNPYQLFISPLVGPSLLVFIIKLSKQSKSFWMIIWMWEKGRRRWRRETINFRFIHFVFFFFMDIHMMTHFNPSKPIGGPLFVLCVKVVFLVTFGCDARFHANTNKKHKHKTKGRKILKPSTR